jgi:hypothetical protein
LGEVWLCADTVANICARLGGRHSHRLEGWPHCLGGRVSEALKWVVVLCGIVVFTVVGLSALDSYDEQTCRKTRPTSVTVVPNPAYDAADFGSGPRVFFRRVPETCDGFLPG